MYAEAFQDEFVYETLGSPSYGVFVDIGGGCDDHTKGSNSLFFEEKGWGGIVIDADINRIRGRKAKCVAAFIGDEPGMTPICSVLNEHSIPNLVDYLSIDIDGKDYYVLKAFLDGGFDFKICTIEHDIYSGNPEAPCTKSNIFNLMTSRGYVRIAENVGNRGVRGNLYQGWPYEDWYINPKYITVSNEGQV
jgi:hypothetical protein